MVSHTLYEVHLTSELLEDDGERREWRKCKYGSPLTSVSRTTPHQLWNFRKSVCNGRAGPVVSHYLANNPDS